MHHRFHRTLSLAVLLSLAAVPAIADATAGFPSQTSAQLDNILSLLDHRYVGEWDSAAKAYVRPDRTTLEKGMLSGLMRLADGKPDLSAFQSGVTGTFAQARAARAALAAAHTDLQDETIDDAMFSGMVAALGDPYVQYVSRQANAPVLDRLFRIRARLVPQTYVCGVSLGRYGKSIRIMAVRPDSPAARNGVVPGDIVLAIDGVATESLSAQEATELVDGEENTNVTLQLRHQDAERSLKLIREREPDVPTLSSKLLAQQIGYVHCTSLDSVTDLDEQLPALMKRGARALILDLRGTAASHWDFTGSADGYFGGKGTFYVTGHTAAERSDMYAVSGYIRPEDPRFPRDSIEADAKPLVSPKLPTVALIDTGTGAYASFLAQWLRQQTHCHLIGTPTLAAAAEMERLLLPGDAGLTNIVQRVQGPNGFDPSRSGVQPDQIVDPAPDATGKTDPQLDAAIAYLIKRQAGQHKP